MVATFDTCAATPSILIIVYGAYTTGDNSCVYYATASKPEPVECESDGPTRSVPFVRCRNVRCIRTRMVGAVRLHRGRRLVAAWKQ
jgi:hypothetical protein